MNFTVEQIAKVAGFPIESIKNIRVVKNKVYFLYEGCGVFCLYFTKTGKLLAGTEPNGPFRSNVLYYRENGLGGHFGLLGQEGEGGQERVKCVTEGGVSLAYNYNVTEEALERAILDLKSTLTSLNKLNKLLNMVPVASSSV